MGFLADIKIKTTKKPPRQLTLPNLSFLTLSLALIAHADNFLSLQKIINALLFFLLTFSPEVVAIAQFNTI